MVAIDGTKIRANASDSKTQRRNALTKELERVEDEVSHMLALAQSTDDNETLEPEPPGLQDQNLQQLRNKLLQAQARLDADPDRYNINLTDQDCRVMHDFGSGYNAQLAVDAAHGVIVAAEVVTENQDAHQLTPMVDQIDHNTGSFGESKIVLADSGYATSTALIELEDRPHIHAYVPFKHDVHLESVRQEPPPFDKRRFSLDLVKGCGTCPLGQPMRVVQRSVNKRGRPYVAFAGTNCLNCTRRSECTRSKYRHIELLLADSAMEGMRTRMKSPLGKRAMALRSQTVEPVIGILKEQLGFRRFHLRGLEKVRGEFALLCGAFDLKKLHRLGLGSSFARTVGSLRKFSKSINMIIGRAHTNIASIKMLLCTNVTAHICA